jgi:hypothetical protein
MPRALTYACHNGLNSDMVVHFCSCHYVVFCIHRHAASEYKLNVTVTCSAGAGQPSAASQGGYCGRM